MVDKDEFTRILEKSGVMDIAIKKRAQRRSNKQRGKLSRGANLLFEQLACKDRPEDNKDAYKAKMRELRDRRKRD